MKKYEKFDGKKTYRTRKSTSLNGGGGVQGGKPCKSFERIVQSVFTVQCAKRNKGADFHQLPCYGGAVGL